MRIFFLNCIDIPPVLLLLLLRQPLLRQRETSVFWWKYRLSEGKLWKRKSLLIVAHYKTNWSSWLVPINSLTNCYWLKACSQEWWTDKLGSETVPFISPPGYEPRTRLDSNWHLAATFCWDSRTDSLYDVGLRPPRACYMGKNALFSASADTLLQS